MDEIVKVLCPSSGRAGKVLTLDSVANVSLVVPVREVDEYSKAYPDTEVIGCPVKGISMTRQWIYETYKNVFMLDDDIQYVMRLYADIGAELIVAKDKAYDIIQSNALTAKMAGISMFGFNKNLDPRTYEGRTPFRFTGFINGCAMGLLEDKNLYYDQRFLLCDDYWINLRNAEVNRIAFIDNRFVFNQHGTFGNTGGASNYRTMDTEKKDLILLRKTFGNAIVLKPSTYLRKSKHEYEKSINLPF